MSIHIEAKQGDIAKVVIMPGDPQRAEYMANKFLTDVKCYTRYRLMYGFTGMYKGKPISIQTSGMGSPSISIITEELHSYDVKTVIRLGTAGTIQDNLDLYDIVIGNVSHSSHDIYARVFPGASFSAAADFRLIKSLYESAEKLHYPVHCGPVLCSETFYEDNYDLYHKFADYGTLAVEMESYALYGIANKYGMKAATVLTISDVIFRHLRGESDKIKSSVDRMTEMILDTAVTNYDYLSGDCDESK